MSMAPHTSHVSPVAIGVIGLGNMGLPMTLNLLKRASLGEMTVTVTGRSRERAAAALQAGATWAETARDLAMTCSIVILMVPDLPQVEELLFGPRGITQASGTTTIVVSSTVSPDGIRTIDERVRADTGGRMRIVDAPVSGGTEGAIAGTLSIMVGGDGDAVEQVLPALAACGSPVHLGPLGAGETAKACNQLIVAATMAAIAEASVIAERSGIDLDTLLSLFEGGYADSRVLETKHRRLVERDYAPTGAARFMVKDLASAAAAAESTGTPSPTLDTVRDTFTRLVAAGLGDEDLVVVHRFIAERHR